MKTVFSNAMCAHVWAQQSQSHGRSNNMSFDGPLLYSYSTPIARIINRRGGAQIALVTSESYSNTTSGKHLPAVHRALRQSARVFYVPQVDVLNHGKNLAHLRQIYDHRKLQFLRAHDLRAYDVHGTIDDYLEEYADTYARYAHTFHFKRVPLPWAKDSAEIKAKREERQARLNTPAAIAKRERAAVRRQEFFRAQHREALANYLAGGSIHYALQALWSKLRITPDEEAQHVAARRVVMQSSLETWRTSGDKSEIPYELRDILSADELAMHRAAVQAKLAVEIATWRQGKGQPYFYLPTGEAILRVRDDEIQTSQGATFPVEHGKRAFKLIAAVRSAGKPWRPNGHSIHLGLFTLDSIDSDGTVHAGCHTVQWAEIERCARELGLLPNDPCPLALDDAHHVDARLGEE